MPAMLDDPTAPAIYRISGDQPYPEPYGQLPESIMPRQVTLRDRVTTASLVPFSSPHQVPPHLTAYLCELLNREIEKGDTYPMMDPIPLSSFGAYWFANLGAVMVVGDVQSAEEVVQMEERGVDWSKVCLGSFYIKPNYPGRSSHVCNGGFLVTDASRNKGVGRLMGETYLEWAPRLGYTYSVFNLVYETNVASLRIWDALGFKRIGRVKGCGNLKSYPDEMIDAIIFGRELGGEGDEYINDERFEKIRFYLKTGEYPAGSDRAEKSRLRSAATHYRLETIKASHDGEEDEDKLMLKGKEVISDPHKQYEIARNLHAAGHGGINKTTAGIADKYHWVRIKETVSAAIRNCPDCKELAPKPSTEKRRGPASNNPTPSRRGVKANADPNQDAIVGASSSKRTARQSALQRQQAAPTATMHVQYDDAGLSANGYGGIPVDPQIMNQLNQWQSGHSMQVDGAEYGSHYSTQKTEDSGDIHERLREQLEAQIRSEQGYGQPAAPPPSHQSQ